MVSTVESVLFAVLFCTATIPLLVSVSLSLPTYLFNTRVKWSFYEKESKNYYFQFRR